MVSSLDLVTVEGEEAVNSRQQTFWIASEVLVEERQILFEEVKLILSDSLEDISIISRKEEELSRTSTLSFSQVKHFASIFM